VDRALAFLEKAGLAPNSDFEMLDEGQTGADEDVEGEEPGGNDAGGDRRGQTRMRVIVDGATAAVRRNPRATASSDED